MTEVWFDQPVELIRADKVKLFWPTNSQSVEDRVNAASRFVVYATCVLYLIRRDVRIFVLGATALGVLYFMYKNDLVKNGMGRSTRAGENDSASCTMPTRENPMGNALLHHYVDQPNKPPACWSPSVDSYRRHYLDNTFKYDSGRSRSPLARISAKLCRASVRERAGFESSRGRTDRIRRVVVRSETRELV